MDFENIFLRANQKRKAVIFAEPDICKSDPPSKLDHTDKAKSDILVRDSTAWYVIKQGASMHDWVYKQC